MYFIVFVHLLVSLELYPGNEHKYSIFQKHIPLLCHRIKVNGNVCQ